MINDRYRSDFVQNLKEKTEGFKQNVKLTEWKIAFCSLCFSLFVITAKLIHLNRKELYDLFYEDKLVSYKTIEENGHAMWHFARTTVTKSSPILLPLFCGFLMTIFTWLMVYLDSSVPGVKPPTPFSPEKYKKQSGHVFHMGYVIAIINGILVFLLMFLSRQGIL